MMSEVLNTPAQSESGGCLRWRPHPRGKHAPVDHGVQRMALAGQEQMRNYGGGSEEKQA